MLDGQPLSLSPADLLLVVSVFLSACKSTNLLPPHPHILAPIPAHAEPDSDSSMHRSPHIPLSLLAGCWVILKAQL